MTKSEIKYNIEKIKHYRKIQKEYEAYFSYLHTKLSSKEKEGN